MKTRMRNVAKSTPEPDEICDRKKRSNAMLTESESPCKKPALNNLHNTMRNKLTMLLEKVTNNPEEKMEKIHNFESQITPFEFVDMNSKILKSESNILDISTNISISPSSSVNDEIIISNIIKNNNITELMHGTSKVEDTFEKNNIKVEINDRFAISNNTISNKFNNRKGRKKIIFADLRQSVIEKCRNGGKISSHNSNSSNQTRQVCSTAVIGGDTCSAKKNVPKHPKITRGRTEMNLRNREKVQVKSGAIIVKDTSENNAQDPRREKTVHKDTTEENSKQPNQCNQCYICSKSFTSKKETKEHFMSKHNIGKISNKTLYPCYFCTRKFSCKKIREYHVKNSHSNAITCPNCKKYFAYEFSFEYHLTRCVYKRPKIIKINKREILFNCMLCESEFAYEVSLKNHIKNIHDKYKYCDKCSSLYKYSKKHTINNCKKLLEKRNLKSKLYELCNFCDKSYPTNTIKKHIYWKHNNEIPKITIVEINEQNEIQMIDSDDNLVPESIENVRQVVHCLNCLHDIAKVNFFSEHILTCFNESKLHCPFCIELDFNGDFLHHVKSHANSSNNKKCFCKLCHKYFVNIYNKNLHSLKYHPINEEQNVNINNNILYNEKINFKRIKSSLSNLINDINNGQ